MSVPTDIPPLGLDNLDEDSLVLIFRHLPLQDLDQLARVCRKFYLVINVYLFGRMSAQLLQTGHQPKPEHCPSRDLVEFDFRKRISLFGNWRYGRYREQQLFYHRTLYFSLILLEKRWLYMTHRGQLKAHQRVERGGGPLKMRPAWCVGSPKEPDINWITKKGELFFAGRADGGGFLYDCESQSYSGLVLADDVVTSVDFEGNVFVSSSKNVSTCFWTGFEEQGEFVLEKRRELGDPYQTIRLSPEGGSQLAAGKYHDRNKNALKLIDVESGITSTLNSPTRAVYQLLWKDANTILTGNFDTTMRMVDVRTAQDVAVWTDPYDASVYCLDYDGAHGVLCGLKHNFRVNLYDLRRPKQCVQMYYSAKRESNYSPVYSLAADSSQLFIVTDHDLRVLNFDADRAESKDYTLDLDKWLY